MNSKINEYVGQVMSYITADESIKSRLPEDLSAHILEASQGRDVDEIIRRMGNPQEMAQDLMDSLYQDKQDVLKALIKAKAEARYTASYYEYKSKRQLFGLPLVHIKFGKKGVGVAKGIIAIGNISVGAISIGGLALGGLCFGGLCAGLLSFGGLALALLLAVGGVAVGAFSVGGLAVGLFSFGGCAIASHIALGGYAGAHVAIGGQANGVYAISTDTSGGSTLHTAAATAAQVKALILKGYPDMPGWIVNLFTMFFK